MAVKIVEGTARSMGINVVDKKIETPKSEEAKPEEAKHEEKK